MKFTKIIHLLFFLIFFKINPGLAQKKNIDSTAYASWSSVISPEISDNGKYVYYTIENQPVGHKTLNLQSTENNWKLCFEDVTNCHFLNANGRDYAVILNQKDSLMIVSLDKNLIQKVPNISSFIASKNGKNEWIAYQLKEQEKKLILQNIVTGKKYIYDDVINQVIGNDGQTVILQCERSIAGKVIQNLSWIDLNTGKRTLIWEGLKAWDIVLDVKHHQLAFIVENGLFSYSLGTQKLICLVDNQSTRFDSELSLRGITRFSNDGDRLFIELKEKDKQKPKPGFVEVWNYRDYKLQSQQESEFAGRTYAAVINLIDGKIIRLEKEFEHLNLTPSSFENELSDTVGIIYYASKLRDGLDSGITLLGDLLLLKNGKKIHLKYRPEGLSPSGKYAVYFDQKQHVYVSYNLKTGAQHTISKVFSENYLEHDLERHAIAGWLEQDEAVFFYDGYDIWKSDLSGQKVSVNLTNRYGRKHGLVFSIVYGRDDHYPIKKNQKLILAAFNLKSKKQGFYSLEPNKITDPELLCMSDHYYGYQDGVTMDLDNVGIAPIKAKNTDVYLVNRMSAKEAPNYFSTKDFKTFKVLSNVHPERQYNWYTTELHEWISLDGTRLQGILCKPENFDPNKRYPVIFNYYEGKSNNLNVYIKPEALCGGCSIDIPTYVSNGYLVFTPDILYKTGDPMQGTYDAVVSAAKYIGSLPFVDAKKMGIQGCSWGGIQTNYLVTHTNLFAAACSSSGIADWISDYGRIFPSNGAPIMGMFEAGQIRMGKSIWEIPDAYIKNSPIFSLDKVTTPFLIMHTKKDDVCSYEDAIELFIGLRRLGKISWMLAYPDEDHGISNKKRASDFSIRMMQFFDHYLKDKPAPVWMTRGIPAERRGLENSYEYDTEIKTPGPGLLTPREQRIVDSIMVRKPILTELK